MISSSNSKNYNKTTTTKTLMAATTLLIKSKKDDFGTRKKSHAQNSYTVNRLFEKVLMPFSECTLVRIQDMKKYTLVRDHPHSSALLLIRTNKLFIALSLKGKLFPKSTLTGYTKLMQEFVLSVNIVTTLLIF